MRIRARDYDRYILISDFLRFFLSLNGLGEREATVSCGIEGTGQGHDDRIETIFAFTIFSIFLGEITGALNPPFLPLPFSKKP